MIKFVALIHNLLLICCFAFRNAFIVPFSLDQFLNDGSPAMLTSLQKKLFEMDKGVEDTNFIRIKTRQIPNSVDQESSVVALMDLLSNRGLPWKTKENA